MEGYFFPEDVDLGNPDRAAELLGFHSIHAITAGEDGQRAGPSLIAWVDIRPRQVVGRADDATTKIANLVRESKTPPHASRDAA